MARSNKFDPSELISEFQNSGMDPSLFEEVDERHLKLAPNFLTWVTGPQFLNSLILPKQISIGTLLFGEYCPRCSKEDYIDHLYDESIGEIKQNVIFLEFGKCPQCGVTRYELFQSKELQEFNELVGCQGQRSGKSKGVGLIATYILHRFLCIPNPLRYFNQPAGEILTGTFSALSADQAEKNLWESFTGFIDSSPWFSNYHKFLKDESKRLKTELFTRRKSYLMYHHKKIIFQFTGSHAKMLRGATRIFASIDELGWFISDDTKDLQIMNADEVYASLSNSLATMRMKHRNIMNESRYNSPPIIMANISSPSSAKDKIMSLIKASKQNQKILAIHEPSWRCNPDYTYESLREEFSHLDDVKFMRDFGAEPPIESSPFLADPQSIDRIATIEHAPKFEVDIVRDIDGMGDKFISGKLNIKSAEKLTPRLISLDLGHSKNGLAMCVFSIGPDSKLRVDSIVSITPEKGRNINISHFFENVTLPLVQNYYIVHVFFDRWQSLDQVSRLRDMKVDANQYSLKYREMEEIRGVVQNKGVAIPKMDHSMGFYVDKWTEDTFEFEDSPSAALGLQMLTVRDLGHRMAKPLQGDDDIFRAFCLGVNRINDPKIRKMYTAGPRSTPGAQSVMPLGTVISKADRGYNNQGLVQTEKGTLGAIFSKKKNR